MTMPQMKFDIVSSPPLGEFIKVNEHRETHTYETECRHKCFGQMTCAERIEHRRLLVAYYVIMLQTTMLPITVTEMFECSQHTLNPLSPKYINTCPYVAYATTCANCTRILLRNSPLPACCSPKFLITISTACLSAHVRQQQLHMVLGQCIAAFNRMMNSIAHWRNHLTVQFFR